MPDTTQLPNNSDDLIIGVTGQDSIYLEFMNWSVILFENGEKDMKDRIVNDESGCFYSQPNRDQSEAGIAPAPNYICNFSIPIS